MFQDLNSYEIAKEAINSSESLVFVNCPLRCYPIFTDIRAALQKFQDQTFLDYRGGDWVGLACNAIHYIDLADFMLDSKIVEVDVSLVDDQIIASKRSGYIEVTGKISIFYDNGHRLDLESIPGSDLASTMKINKGSVAYELEELTGKYKVFDHDIEIKTDNYEILYQSKLTSRLIQELYETGSCGLPDYERSSSLHKTFLGAMLKRYSEITGRNENCLAIT